MKENNPIAFASTLMVMMINVFLFIVTLMHGRLQLHLQRLYSWEACFLIGDFPFLIYNKIGRNAREFI